MSTDLSLQMDMQQYILDNIGYYLQKNLNVLY